MEICSEAALSGGDSVYRSLALSLCGWSLKAEPRLGGDWATAHGWRLAPERPSRSESEMSGLRPGGRKAKNERVCLEDDDLTWLGLWAGRMQSVKCSGVLLTDSGRSDE